MIVTPKPSTVSCRNAAPGAAGKLLGCHSLKLLVILTGAIAIGGCLSALADVAVVDALTFPGASPSSDLARRAPQVIFEPGPEYGDDFRRFQGIPSIEYGGNERLWAAWYGGGDGENEFNFVMLSTSADNGDTWKGLHLVIDPEGSDTVPGFDAEEWRKSRWADEVRTTEATRAYDPALWRDPAGRLWLFWAQNSGGYWETPATWAITTENPEAASPTWSKPFYVADGVMMNKPTALSSGEWLFPMAYWKDEKSSTVLVTGDEGKTFQFRGGATIPDIGDRNADEHMIVERADGSLLMWTRTQYGIGQSVSEDGGWTWTPVEKSNVEHTMARFFLGRLQSGNLLLVKHGDLDEVSGRHSLTAFLSTDDGGTWQGGLCFREGSGSYPDVAQDQYGRIFVIHDSSRRALKEIRMASFTEEDILSGKPVSGYYRSDVLVNRAYGVSLRGYDLASNDDGAPFVVGPKPRIEPIDGEIAQLDRWTKLFSDRDYRLAHLPPELTGRAFVRGSMDGTVVRVRTAGVVTVLTPRPEVNSGGSLTDVLREDGFVRVNLPESVLFWGRNNVCTAYQKKVRVGEKISIGKWGILVF